MIRRALRDGLRAGIRCWPAAVWSWVGTWLVALPFAAAVFALVLVYTGRSLDAELFAAAIEPVRAVAILLELEKNAAGFIGVFAGLVVLWAAVSTYATGAVLFAAHRDEPTSTHELFEGGGRVFGRMMRLTTLCTPFWLLVVGGVSFALYKGTGRLVRDWSSEPGVIAVRWSAILLAVLIACWAGGACDLARAEAVARGERRARFAFWRGLVRASRKPFSMLALSAPFGLGAAAVTFFSLLLDVRLPRSSIPLIVLGLLLQQATIFTRAWIRVGALATATRWNDRQRRGEHPTRP